MSDLPLCAILDDYQSVALGCADWSVLDGRVDLRCFSQPLRNLDQVVAALAECTIVVAMRERTAFPRDLLARLPNLRLLITTGARNNSIDLEAARDLGIVVSGTRSFGSPAAELAWAGILAFQRRIPDEVAGFRRGGPWQTGLGHTVEGKTLGIVGLGKLGRKMAAMGQVFGMEVCGWTRRDVATRAADLTITPVDLETLFSTADVITLQLALNAGTRGIVTRELLARMKPNALLVNTARGPLVDEAALIEVLREGRIAGAVLDVFDHEPLPLDHPFRSLPNVLATPHLGYVTAENYQAYFADVVEDIRSWLDGASLRPLT